MTWRRRKTSLRRKSSPKNNEVIRMPEDLFNSEVVIPATTVHKIKRLNFTVPAGKTLKIETTPDGKELGSGTVPAGQECDVTITIVVKFRDV